MWKWKKKEAKKEEKKEENLLKELCGDDTKLYEAIGHYLYINPLTAISKTEKDGYYDPGLNQSIFEAAQNPGERERYIKVIQNLALKTIHATEQEKEKAEKQGLTAHAASLGRSIENQKFISERAEDIINVASKYYNEKLVGLGEDLRRKGRREERIKAKSEEERIRELEKAEREERKEERSGMRGEEKREAIAQGKREELAAKERREVRGEARREAEREEERIGELEKAEREERKEERSEN
jgi:hypothetical protein